MLYANPNPLTPILSHLVSIPRHNSQCARKHKQESTKYTGSKCSYMSSLFTESSSPSHSLHMPYHARSTHRDVLGGSPVGSAAGGDVVVGMAGGEVILSCSRVVVMLESDVVLS